MAQVPAGLLPVESPAISNKRVLGVVELMALFSRIDHKCHFPNCPVNCCCMGEDNMKDPEENALNYDIIKQAQEKMDQADKVWIDEAAEIPQSGWDNLREHLHKGKFWFAPKKGKGYCHECMETYVLGDHSGHKPGCSQFDPRYKYADAAGKAASELAAKMAEAYEKDIRKVFAGESLFNDEDEEEELLDTPDGINDYDCSIRS